VLALDLGEEAAELGAAALGRRRLGGVQKLGERLQRDLVGRDAEAAAGLREQADAVALQAGAALHLGLHLAEARLPVRGPAQAACGIAALALFAGAWLAAMAFS